MENRSKPVARCEKCGGPLAVRILPEYQHEALGIPGVVLENVVEETYCKKCGEVDSIGFPNLDGLIAAAAAARARMPVKLNPAEVRFLRRAMGWSARGLARKLLVREETVSRWENGHEPIGATSEKLLRTLVGIYLAPKAPAIGFDLKAIAEMGSVAEHPVRGVRMRFRFSKKGNKAFEQVRAA